jgi:sugar phosphate isomerase/epimerase
MAFDPYAPGAIMELTDHGRLDASAPDFADRLAAKLERRGYEPHIARALGKKAAAEHDALRDLEEALDELDAAGKWGAEQVNGLGGRRRRPPSDRLLDAATARLRRANERAGEALAELTAQQRA